MAGSSNIDAQLSDMVTGSASCGEHAIKRAREYAASAHFIGLLAGVVGSDAEQSEARETVKAVLADIGFSADDATNRKAVTEMSKEWYRLKYETPTSGMSPTERAAHNARIAEIDDAISNNPVVQKWSPQGVFNRLWNSLADIYNKAVKFVREDMWKKSLCELSVDAGFIILETGVAAALAAAGLAAAAAFLKVIAIASKGSKLVTITVKATRGLKGGAASRNPAHALGSERKYGRQIDTGEVNPDAKKLLDESGQGNATKPDRSPAKGDEDGGKKKSTKAIGDAAEAQAKKDLAAKGFTDQRTITNPQGNGVDIIARNPTTGDVVFGEVKANTASLSTDQAFRGGPDYVRDRLNRVANQLGEWKNATAQQRADAEDALEWLKQNPKFKEIKYDVDPNTGKATNYREKDWSYSPGQRTKDLKWRGGDGKDVPRKKRPKAKPDATGPPEPPLPFGGPR